MYGLLDNWLKENQGLLIQLLVIFPLKKIILCQNTNSILLHASSLIIAQKIKIKIKQRQQRKKRKEKKTGQLVVWIKKYFWPQYTIFFCRIFYLSSDPGNVASNQ